MPNSGDVIYWDASVFLSCVNGETERLPTIDALREESRKGDFTIVTSTLSITEVAFAEMEQTRGAPSLLKHSDGCPGFSMGR